MTANDDNERARFTRIDEAEPEEWQVIQRHYNAFVQGHADAVIEHLKGLAHDHGGFPVSRLEHVLQTATLAQRDGRDEEYVVCALVHDIGDYLAPYNHADLAASVLKPFVTAESHWMVEHHAVFQGYYYFHHVGLDRNMRERFRGHPCFEATALFCERYDQRAFDAGYESAPLEAFVPALRRVFAKPKQSMYLPP